MFERMMAMAANATNRAAEFLGDAEKVKNVAGAIAGVIGIGVAVKTNRNKILEKAVLEEQLKASKRANDLFDETFKEEQ